MLFSIPNVLKRPTFMLDKSDIYFIILFTILLFFKHNINAHIDDIVVSYFCES